MLRPLEATLNKSIDASSQARETLARLGGRCLALNLRGSPFSIYLMPSDSMLALSFEAQGDPEAALCGSPLGLAALALSDPREVLRSGSVSIEGDAELAQDFQLLLQQAKPDWEEELSGLIGDVAAHQVGKLFRNLVGWGQSATRTVASNAGEFFTEESRDLPTNWELQQFLQRVDETRETVDRLEARLKRMERRARDRAGQD